MNWKVACQHRCLLGESPVWDHRKKRILWIDILNGEIHGLYPGSSKSDRFYIGRIIGSIALKKGDGIIATVERSFATIDIEGKTVAFIAETETELKNNRFNDGKCDPAGRFWAGTMSVEGIKYAGSLYTLESDLAVRKKLPDITCSNGLAWSIDQKTMYYIDTEERNVKAFEYNMEDGSLGKGKTVITIPANTGYPDGMTIDTEGMLWIAIWGGSRIIRFDPRSGKELSHFILPVSQVTSCIFGGSSLEDLYITSAAIGLSEAEFKKQPLAGSLFVIPDIGFRGTESVEFS
jgi:sugar lactone lactonase YvrE